MNNNKQLAVASLLMGVIPSPKGIENNFAFITATG